MNKLFSNPDNLAIIRGKPFFPECLHVGRPNIGDRRGLMVATNFLKLPSSINVYFRPAVAIPLFFGVAFGPIVGFVVGFIGNIIVDFIYLREFWIWWDIGVGLMGLITGSMAFSFTSFKTASTLLQAERLDTFWSAGWDGDRFPLRNVGLWSGFEHDHQF